MIPLYNSDVCCAGHILHSVMCTPRWQRGLTGILCGTLALCDYSIHTYCTGSECPRSYIYTSTYYIVVWWCLMCANSEETWDKLSNQPLTTLTTFIYVLFHIFVVLYVLKNETSACLKLYVRISKICVPTWMVGCDDLNKSRNFSHLSRGVNLKHGKVSRIQVTILAASKIAFAYIKNRPYPVLPLTWYQG